MKECINCKAILENDELFCHECGTKQELEEMTNQDEVLSVSEEQSVIEEMYCVHCGKAMETDSLYCPHCGKPQEVNEVKSDDSQVIEEPQVKEELKAEEPLQNEETTYEWEEEKKSKTWLWVLLAILAVVGAVLLYFSVNKEPMKSLEDDNVENVDSVATKQEVDNNAPKSALAFIEEFYKGDFGDNAYIKSHVTANVLTKLKNDYDYDCPSNDCLATWIFTAYPAGADMTLEEGPTITSTDKDGVYKLDFWYSFYNGYNKGFETRSIYLTITNIDGRYLISDYQIKEKDTNETEVEEFDEAAMMDNLAKRNLEANGLDKNGE